MVNEVYLYLVAQREHHEKCTAQRCVSDCEIVKFDRMLEEPLLLSDARQADQIRERFEALKRGDIPA